MTTLYTHHGRTRSLSPYLHWLPTSETAFLSTAALGPPLMMSQRQRQTTSKPLRVQVSAATPKTSTTATPLHTTATPGSSAHHPPPRSFTAPPRTYPPHPTSPSLPFHSRSTSLFSPPRASTSTKGPTGRMTRFSTQSLSVSA